MLVKTAFALCFYLGRLTMDKTVEESPQDICKTFKDL